MIHLTIFVGEIA